MTTTDPAVQAVAEAMHADLCPDDECDGSDMGEWDRQAEVAVAAARPIIEAQALAEAADDLGDMVDNQHPAALNPDQWLRDRADDLEAGQ